MYWDYWVTVHAWWLRVVPIVPTVLALRQTFQRQRRDGRRNAVSFATNPISICTHFEWQTFISLIHYAEAPKKTPIVATATDKAAAEKAAADKAAAAKAAADKAAAEKAAGEKAAADKAAAAKAAADKAAAEKAAGEKAAADKAAAAKAAADKAAAEKAAGEKAAADKAAAAKAAADKSAAEKAVQKKAGSWNAFGTCNAREHHLPPGHLGQVESAPAPPSGEESLRSKIAKKGGYFAYMKEKQQQQSS